MITNRHSEGTAKGLMVSKYLRSHWLKCITDLEHSNHNLATSSTIASEMELEKKHLVAGK